MKNCKKIRDSVYDYIELTPLEELLVDTPLFQRLRFISQNSSAYLSYPSNNVTRFSHSLGVMHLSGKMFIKSLEKSNKDDLREFLDRSRKLYKGLLGSWRLDADGLVKFWESDFGNLSGFRHQPFNGMPIDLQTNHDIKDLFIINTLWQSVRIAGVIHDIGHLPLSHIFEFAIEDYQQFDEAGDEVLSKEIDARSSKLEKQIKDWLTPNFGSTGVPIHELIGISIALNFKPKNLQGTSQDVARFVLHLGSLIFLTNKNNIEIKKYEILACLHTIISSDIDADRLDYSVRDPKSSGLELGAIDINRILDSLILLHSTGKRTT